MNESENPKAIQSKMWIINALLELMRQKQFREITIKEIAIQAQLDRRTFYRNFHSKEDVLKAYIKLLSDEYATALLKEENLTISICLEVFLIIAEKYKNFLMELKDNNLLLILLDTFNKILPTIHNLIEDKFDNNSNLIDNNNLEYIFTYNIGGFWNVLIKWIDNDFNELPQEITDVLSNLRVK